MKKTVLLFFSITAAILLLSGCGGNAKRADSPAASTAGGPSGTAALADSSPAASSLAVSPSPGSSSSKSQPAGEADDRTPPTSPSSAASSPAFPASPASSTAAVTSGSPGEESLFSCGELTLGEGSAATKLPLSCIRGTYGLDAPKSQEPPAPLQLSGYLLPPSLSGKLAGYWLSEGDFDPARGLLVLAPDRWIVNQGAIGANGSSAVRLENPEKTNEYVRFQDDGACVGCITSQIGAYFPELESWADEQGFPPRHLPDIQKRSMLNSNFLFYKDAGTKENEVLGIAYQMHEGDSVFRSLEVALPTSRHDEAIALLQFFLFQNRYEGPALK